MKCWQEEPGGHMDGWPQLLHGGGPLTAVDNWRNTSPPLPHPPPPISKPLPRPSRCQPASSKHSTIVTATFPSVHASVILKRRRIKTEEKAKVVAPVRGEAFIQFLAALAILPRMILKNKMKSSFFQIIMLQFILLFKIVLGKTASAARNLINSSPAPPKDDLYLLLSLSLFYAFHHHKKHPQLLKDSVYKSDLFDVRGMGWDDPQQEGQRDQQAAHLAVQLKDANIHTVSKYTVGIRKVNARRKKVFKNVQFGENLTVV